MAEISIITPVLNQVDYIEKCILSVAAQDVQIEHIIIDGGSTDGTVEVIEKHKNKLSFWSSEKDSGQSHAINKGLKHFTGKFFNWLNADDTLKADSLSTILAHFDSETNVVVGKCEHIDKHQNTLRIGSARIWNCLEVTLGNYSMGQPSVFYRTEIVRQLGGLNTQLHYCMDMDLWFRYLLHFGQSQISVTDRVLSTFLVHSDSKSVKTEMEMQTEKYGIYHALFRGQKLPEVISAFFDSYPVPGSVNYKIKEDLNYTEILSNFCWHLMQKAYEEKNVSLCKDYFDIVKQGSVLSKTEKVKWAARIKVLELMKR